MPHAKIAPCMMTKYNLFGSAPHFGFPVLISIPLCLSFIILSVSGGVVYWVSSNGFKSNKISKKITEIHTQESFNTLNIEYGQK